MAVRGHPELRFEHRPSTAAFMLGAWFPTALRRPGRFPPLRASWPGHRAEPRRLEAFLRLTGLGAGGGLPLLYPHVFGFPLLMVILTHPSFPLPIWRVLQIRNHLLQHRAIPADAALDLETCVAGQRVLEKGVELDLHTTARLGAELAWESLNTFYYRGRFGEADPPSPWTRAPEVGEQVAARWITPSGGGWQFGGLTGDYNPIHLWSRYARRLGFRGAFHHPQLVLGQCLARLPPPGPAAGQRLDTWLKGPVYQASEVRLRTAAEPDGTAFALLPGEESRPAILGLWRTAPAGARLIDAAGQPA